MAALAFDRESLGERFARPLRLTRLEGAMMGIIGRKLKYDPNVSQFDDVDLSLECCLKERFCWQDSRFAAEHNFITKGGGNTISRGLENTKRELQYMKRKWGPYLGVGYGKEVISLKVKVERNQDLDV